MCAVPFAGQEDMGPSTLGSLTGIRQWEDRHTEGGLGAGQPSLLVEEPGLDAFTTWAEKELCEVAGGTKPHFKLVGE